MTATASLSLPYDDPPALVLPPLAPYVRDSATSEAAAVEITPFRNVGQFKVVRVLYLSDEPQTDQQIQESSRMDGNTERPRRGEAVTLGLVQHVDDEGVTKSGRKAARWELTEAGRKAFEDERERRNE
jgi:hypothetical protein